MWRVSHSQRTVLGYLRLCAEEIGHNLTYVQPKMCGKLNSITVLLLVAAFCGLGKSGNVFNFTCDLSPEKHDQVLQEAITKLRRGKLILAPYIPIWCKLLSKTAMTVVYTCAIHMHDVGRKNPTIKVRQGI